MKYKVYQLQRVREVITASYASNKKFPDYHSTYDIKMNVIAEYENEKANMSINNLLEDIYDGCNISCWDSRFMDMWENDHTLTYTSSDETKMSFTQVFQGFVNSDIIVETSDGLYLCLSAGWLKVPDLNTAMYRIIWANKYASWDEIRNKWEFNLTIEKLMETGQIVKVERDEWHKWNKENTGNNLRFSDYLNQIYYKEKTV